MTPKPTELSEAVALEPLPCPFCGAAAVIDDISTSYRRGSPPLWFVGCMNDDCPLSEATGQTSENKAEAITAWNTRLPASQPPMESVVEAGWQPIETLDVAALKDDDEMLIYNDRGTFVGAWQSDWSLEHGFHGGWWIVSDGKDYERSLRGNCPTHWRPLPEAPVNEEGRR